MLKKIYNQKGRRCDLCPVDPPKQGIIYVLETLVTLGSTFSIRFCSNCKDTLLSQLKEWEVHRHPDLNPETGLASMPEKYLGQFYNGCNEPCDMLEGCCTCGATHHQEEWPDGIQMEVFGAVSEKITQIKRRPKGKSKVEFCKGCKYVKRVPFDFRCALDTTKRIYPMSTPRCVCFDSLFWAY